MKTHRVRVLLSLFLTLAFISVVGAWQAPTKDVEVYWITGEVKAPGQRIWEAGATVGSAIAAAEGLTDRADLGRSFIQRKNARGEYDQIGDLTTDTPILARDAITIRSRLF